MIPCHHCGSPCEESYRFCKFCGATVASSSTAETDPLIGRTVGGAYTLQESVGVGGMGRVYRAEQTALGRTVAVKVIHPHLLGDEQTVARFYTEARAASRLNHPNSVSIIDFGRTDDGILYLVMEFLQGKDLAMIMHEEGPLPFLRIVDALCGVLGALGEAHALGVVHRDLKPENVIIKRLRSGGDLVKVVDFGLATIVGGGQRAITSPGIVCGTPDYMSPEQGKGDEVDGRGDLYSLGVVLFELLTDQLPFEEETPTKVLLRHINDPVPDPTEVAPQRRIPQPLVRVVEHALRKHADDRYQSAEEMERALKQAKSEIVADQSRAEAMVCGVCGAENQPTMRFCGSCGARLAVAIPTPTAPTRGSVPPRGSFTSPPPDVPLVGRQEEVARLKKWLGRAKDNSVRVHLVGEPGIGKTRILSELARLAQEEGDVVVGAVPHATRAPVPYGSLPPVFAALLEVEESQLSSIALEEPTLSDPLVRAGIAELLEPRGLRGFAERGRVGAVTAALSAAAGFAARRANSGRVVLVVDDLHACDGLTQDVVERLVQPDDDQALLLVTAGHVALPESEHVLHLTMRGLDESAAQELGGGRISQVSLIPKEGDGVRLMLPLYLQQVQALGDQIGDDSVPPRLADAVAQRLDRLDMDARRMVQAIAVLGDRCERDELGELTGDVDLMGLAHLRKEQLVETDDHIIRIVHPFIRDLVESSIPAEARRSLHQRALKLATERSAPLEVRAEHAYRAGEPMSALMILERMGDLALERGDAKAGVLAYRRALEIGRREMLEAGDVMLEGAIVTFSRKLGEALARSDEVTGADGVLREALDLANPHSVERARMLVALGRVAARRDRPRDATRFLGQALEIASSQKEAHDEARIHLALGRLRRADGDELGAANAFQRAVQLFSQDQDRDLKVRGLIEAAETAHEVGDPEHAEGFVSEAEKIARGLHAPALLALVLGTRGTLCEATDQPDEATAAYAEAIRLAAEAGDAESRAHWTGRAAALAD